MNLIEYRDPSSLHCEQFTIRQEVETLDDTALLDEVTQIAVEIANPIVDKILLEYFEIGTISNEQRKFCQDFYILCYSTILFEE